MKSKKKSKDEIIRCSSTTLKFSNYGKINNLSTFIDEYQKVVSITVDYLWNMEEISSLLPKEITDIISSQTWLSARSVQSACKQASGIVRGTRAKQKKRLAMIKILNKEKQFKKARKLQRKYDKVKTTKPNIENVCPELDERFIDMDLENETMFDGWITMTSLGNKIKLVLPFKKTKHFNKMLEEGKIKKGIRISKDKITFNFLIKKPIPKENGEIIGIDIGCTDVCAMSDNSHTQFKKDIHGHTLESIQKKLTTKKKGSKAFARGQKHRTNYIKWYLNQINFDNVKKIKIENIKNLRKGKRISRYLSAWTYPLIRDGLLEKSYRLGVQVDKVCPTYTSQRCSKCGWTRKKNRKGKKFVCTACNFACDADHNASLNILLDLSEISKKERLLHKNRNGFYWNVVRQEPIVPAVQKVA